MMASIDKLEEEAAVAMLLKSGREFLSLFERSGLSVEIYKPHLSDKQSPHDRDEFYLVISGEGEFEIEGQTTGFRRGDFLFVPAHAKHRFTRFSEDFVTWVFFIG